MAISVRGSSQRFVNNVATDSITLPTGSTAGDLCILHISHGWDTLIHENPESGFRLLDNQTGFFVCGGVYEKELTAADITRGSVQVQFKNAFYGWMTMVAFVGSLSGYRTHAEVRNQTGVSSFNLSTNSTPQSGDYALYYCGARAANSTITSSRGSNLQTLVNANWSGVLAGELLAASGAITDTFSLSVAGSSYGSIVIVSEVPKTGLQLRQPLEVSEALSEGAPAQFRQPFLGVDALSEGSPSLKQPLIEIDDLSEGRPALRQSLIVIEILCPVDPDETMSTALFPGSQGSSVSLPGLQWPVGKRPTWSTAVYKGAPGVSVRRANMQYPIWEFTLSYEFLRDSVNQEFQILLDFFLARQGGFDTFLFKDKDDYQVTNGTIGNSDGVTTQFSFKRTFGTAGTFYEKVGQVDTGNTIVIYHTPSGEAHTIPNTPGPYTITINHPQATSPTITQDLGVTFTIGGTALTYTAGAPAAGQYTVNLSTGVYTFNSADANKGVNITYRYVVLNTNYTVTMPNLVIFTSAPTTGTISADFQFFFNCRFQDDAADFDKFAMTFWELQKIVLETVPQ